MVINKVNINVYCNYNGTKRLNEKNPENTSYRKFWIGFGSDLGPTWDGFCRFGQFWPKSLWDWVSYRSGLGQV